MEYWSHLVAVISSIMTLCVIMTQCYIAAKKRKDNLFQIRYKCYLEIREHTLEILNTLIDPRGCQELYPETGLYIPSDDKEYNYNYHLEAKLIFKVQYLFDNEIAEYLVNLHGASPMVSSRQKPSTNYVCPK